MARVHVIKPGLLTTVQDLGRWGYQALGVPVAGPMDPCSHRLANALVGNTRTPAALEITLTGPELEFDDERIVAVAGAEFECAGRQSARRRGVRGLRRGNGCGSARGAGAPARTSRFPAASSAAGLEPRDTRAEPWAVGGRPLRAGDALPLGRRGSRRAHAAAWVHE